MNRLLMLILVLLCFSTAAFSGQQDLSVPSWCNNNNLLDVEIEICSDATLTQADKLVGQLFEDIMSFRGLEGQEGMWPGEVISDQRDWLVSRNRMRGKDQLIGSYGARIQELFSTLMYRLSIAPAQ